MRSVWSRTVTNSSQKVGGVYQKCVHGGGCFVWLLKGYSVCHPSFPGKGEKIHPIKEKCTDGIYSTCSGSLFINSAAWRLVVSSVFDNMFFDIYQYCTLLTQYNKAPTLQCGPIVHGCMWEIWMQSKSWAWILLCHRLVSNSSLLIEDVAQDSTENNQTKRQEEHMHMWNCSSV